MDLAQPLPVPYRPPSLTALHTALLSDSRVCCASFCGRALAHAFHGSTALLSLLRGSQSPWPGQMPPVIRSLWYPYTRLLFCGICHSKLFFFLREIEDLLNCWSFLWVRFLLWVKGTYNFFHHIPHSFSNSCIFSKTSLRTKSLMHDYYFFPISLDGSFAFINVLSWWWFLDCKSNRKAFHIWREVALT